MATALITGGSKGFGKALASELAARGWEVVVTGRDRSAVEDAAGEIGRHVEGIAGDVTDPDHRSRLQGRFEGGLDLLVNNASRLGPSPLVPLDQIGVEEVSRILDVNTVAPLDLTRRLLPHLRSDGAVVNVSSDAAVEAYPGWGAYGASKAALDRWSAVLAVEHPEVRVYAFDPGDMRTDLHQAAFPDEDISDRPEPESVVPALLHLLDTRPASGRYRAVDVALTFA